MVGYRIIYGAEPVLLKKECGSRRLRFLIGMCFLAFVLAVRLAWPEGRELLVMQFIPGDLTVTEAALLQFTDNLRAGIPMADSLTVFCRDVLHEILSY